MRNVLAHDHRGVNLEIVWEVATIHVPEPHWVPPTCYLPIGRISRVRVDVTPVV
jgi:hypothetical protein